MKRFHRTLRRIDRHIWIAELFVAALFMYFAFDLNAFVAFIGFFL